MTNIKLQHILSMEYHHQGVY